MWTVMYRIVNAMKRCRVLIGDEILKAAIPTAVEI